MLGWVRNLPFFIVLMGFGSIAMLVPSAHALSLNDFNTMRVFFYGFLLFGMLTGILALATSESDSDGIARGQLFSLLAAFTILPIMFAIPFFEAQRDIRLLDAWFEMVSSFTTTGATVFDDPSVLKPAMHLWRGLVAWMGGLLIWITAIAIFAPLNLGGFEVKAETGSAANVTARHYTQTPKYRSSNDRLSRYASALIPIYFGLTFLLWVGLTAIGEAPYVALIHAMSVLSTSGISAVGGLAHAGSGFFVELLIFAFFFFAISRLTFGKRLFGESDGRLRRDPEIQIGVALIVATTLLLFGLHFFGATAESDGFNLIEIGQAVWGAVFTITSFLTTTGFESQYWDSTTDWSGLKAPGLVLMGLALIGGGVATTAGGVKLLRIFALYQHSRREMGRLVYPSSVAGGGIAARHLRTHGAMIAWTFFMLFALSIGGVMIALSLIDVPFETSMVLAVSALSTTGPLAQVAGEVPIAFSTIPDLGKFVLAGAMVLGRLETLAIIALFSADIWRN